MAEQPQVVSFMNKPMQALSMEEQKKAVPAYTIEAAKRTRTVNKAVKDELGFRVVPTVVEVEGYMVRTLRGDSVFLEQEDVVRLKLDRNLVPLLLEGGDDTPVGMQQSPALTDKHKVALDALSQLLERDPTLVDRLLADAPSAEETTEAKTTKRG